MLKTSRQKVIEYLQNRDAATASDISRALHTTQSNARHHLSTLLEEGVVRIIGERRSNNRGRPAQIYVLMRSSTRHNLDRLSAALLDISQETPSIHPGSIFQQLAYHLAAPVPTTNNLTQRLNQVVQRLNQMGYEARWEAHAAGPRLILGHCPYTLILDRHPAICTMDSAMLSVLLGKQAILESRLEPAPTGLPQCTFRITK